MEAGADAVCDVTESGILHAIPPWVLDLIQQGYLLPQELALRGKLDYLVRNKSIADERIRQIKTNSFPSFPTPKAE